MQDRGNSHQLNGGLLQYAHETNDIDESILVLRDRDPNDFLAPLAEYLSKNKDIEFALCIVYIFVLLYPDAITLEHVKEYELRHNKQFVPDPFIKTIPLFGQASALLLQVLERAWPEHKEVLAGKLADLHLSNFSSQMFPDEKRQQAAEVLLTYSLQRHVYLQQILTNSLSDKEIPVLVFVAERSLSLQREEILNIYFEKLLGANVIRYFYAKNIKDLYPDDYSLITLPIRDDPFLAELDKVLAYTKEHFYDPPEIIKYFTNQQDKQLLPDSLIIKIIMQEFINKTNLSPEMLEYAFILGHMNVSKHEKTLHIPIGETVISYPYEKQPLVAEEGTYGFKKENLYYKVTALIEGFYGDV